MSQRLQSDVIDCYSPVCPSDWLWRLLQECRETLVGDNVVRGISGGQKKRVTSGNAQLSVLGCLAIAL